jgi:RNA polymerase sigma-70 factor, ECF subfamily
MNSQCARFVPIFAQSAMDRTDSRNDSASASDATQELTELFERYRDRLKLMVHLRLDRRLQPRIDSSDVLQEAFLEGTERYERYKAKPTMPPFLWLRFLVGQRLILMHRRHLGVKARAAGREVSLFHGALPEANSESLAAQLLGKLSSPSQVAMRSELQVRLQEALNSMDEIDREVLVLRHFEQLSNCEVAAVLGLAQQTASKRYVTALRRLREILGTMPGFFDDASGNGRSQQA